VEKFLNPIYLSVQEMQVMCTLTADEIEKRIIGGLKEAANGKGFVY
jgi:hypothetical protein